ncbi:unnamed protein product [Caenorhabditis nigoni]
MSDLESLVSKKEEHLCSLISEELEKRFANFSDEPKVDEFPRTFELDEISKLEKLEDKLKKAKEVLNSRIDKEKKDVWAIKLTLLLAMILIIFVITLIMNENSNDYFSDGTAFLLKVVLIVEAVFLILLFIFTVVEEIIYQIANRKRRRTTKHIVLLEDGDEKNEKKKDEKDCENLKNRYRKLVEDLHDNYEPMRNRYQRLCNQYVFYRFVSFFIIVMMGISSVLDAFLYSTEEGLNKILRGFCQLTMLIGFSIVHHPRKELNFKIV